MFRLKITRMIFLLAVVSYLVGCSAHQIILPPLFDIQPLEEQIGYFNEEETQCANTYMEFIGQEEDLFLFYVEVENNSEDVLAVYPTEIYLEVVEEAHTQNNMYTKKYSALDPEREIAEINRNDERRR